MVMAGGPGFQPRLASLIKNPWPAALSCPAAAVVSAHCGPCLWTNARHTHAGAARPARALGGFNQALGVDQHDYTQSGCAACEPRAHLDQSFSSGLSRLWLPVGGTEIAADSSVTISMYCSCRRRSFNSEASQHVGG